MHLPSSYAISSPVGSSYVYSSDLRSLEAIQRPVPSLPIGLPKTSPTPLLVQVWEKALEAHPDRWYRDYIVQGLQLGFHIGFHGSRSHLRSAKRNIPSAYEYSEVVDKYLKEELSAGRLVGPLAQPPPGLQVSRFGVIPKTSQPGKWRLIVDLSSPEGVSVNDGVDEALCSLHYPSFDVAARLLLEFGPGALMSKLDIKEAYRMVPVHPEDWLLLGMQWRNSYFLDTRLPFGLRSAPKIFTAVADALQWIMLAQGVKSFIHYLDDFFFVEPPGLGGVAISRALAIWESLGVPVAPNKVEGPSTSLCFLGLELDSTTLTARLPADKLARLRQLVADWGDRKVCRKRDLLSLIGVLQHASAVVQFGRCFLRHMIDLSTTASQLHHHIRLNREFRSDLLWWSTLAPHWNGCSLLAPAFLSIPDIIVHTDASGSWGFGGFSTQSWFQGEWPENWKDQNITAKELLPILLAAGSWGHTWGGKAIEFKCDNLAIVGSITSWRSKEPLVMNLLRSLALLAMHFRFHLKASHIAGSRNVAADALSRNDLLLFRSQVPEALPHPSPIHPTLEQLFLRHHPDWLSSTWRADFSAFCQRG